MTFTSVFQIEKPSLQTNHMFSKLKRRVNDRSRRFNMEYTIEIIFMNTRSVFGGLYMF